MKEFKSNNKTSYLPDIYQETKNPFTSLPDHIINDKALLAFPEAFAIFWKIYSYSGTDYIIHKSIIQNHFVIKEKDKKYREEGIGVNKFNKAWALLIKQGYLKRELKQKGTHWVVDANPYGIMEKLSQVLLSDIKKELNK